MLISPVTMACDRDCIALRLQMRGCTRRGSSAGERGCGWDGSMWGKSELRMKRFVLRKSRRGEGIGEERTEMEENNGISYVGRMVRFTDECFELNSGYHCVL